MNNNFAEEYNIRKTIEAAYRLGKEKQDENMVETARTSMKQFNEMLEQKGESYCTVFRLYTEAQERGNKHIDLSENVWGRDVPNLISDFREFGISNFTFSSGWTESAESAWLFLQNGCRLEGMVELHGDEKFSRSLSGSEREYETVHGYLFSIG